MAIETFASAPLVSVDVIGHVVAVAATISVGTFAAAVLSRIAHRLGLLRDRIVLPDAGPVAAAAVMAVAALLVLLWRQPDWTVLPWWAAAAGYSTFGALYAAGLVMIEGRPAARQEQDADRGTVAAANTTGEQEQE